MFKTPFTRLSADQNVLIYTAAVMVFVSACLGCLYAAVAVAGAIRAAQSTDVLSGVLAALTVVGWAGGMTWMLGRITAQQSADSAKLKALLDRPTVDTELVQYRLDDHEEKLASHETRLSALERPNPP